MAAETAETDDEPPIEAGTTTDGVTGRGGLQRWREAFGLILAVLALGVAVDVIAVRVLVHRVIDTSDRIEEIQAVSAGLQHDLVAYGDDAHLQIEQVPNAGSPTDEAASRFTRQSVISGFEDLIDRDVADSSALVQEAYERWTDLDDSVLGHPAASADERLDQHVQLEDEIAALGEMLDEAAAIERAAGRDALSDARSIEYLALAAILGSGVIVAVLLVAYARRISTRVLTPIDALRASTRRLAAGDIDHRVELKSDNELADLVAAFNAMAEAMAGSQRTLSHQARHDSLTGLANRIEFAERLESSLGTAETRSSSLAILFVDLDDFKYVNDTLGHAAGDDLLRAVAQRIVSVVRPQDVVARLGGDEFAVLLHEIVSEDAAAVIADRVVMVLVAPLEVAGATVTIGASVGLAMYAEGADADQLMRDADVAMYTAKRAGKNRVERFDVRLRLDAPTAWESRSLD